MNHLIRQELELEQFECEKCGRFVYLNKMEIEAVRQANPDKVILPDCPFNCWSETKRRRTIRVDIREVKDSPDIEIYLKELKKPDDIIEVHKTLENLFGE